MVVKSREVTGSRMYGKGLEVPCVYKFLGSRNGEEDKRYMYHAEVLKNYSQLSVAIDMTYYLKEGIMSCH